MSIEISDYPDVRDRATKLGLNIPSELAILPRNFDSVSSKADLLFESSTSTVRNLWRQAGLMETRLEMNGQRFPFISEKSLDWLGPTIFVGAAIASQNATAVAIAINVISTYLTEHVFKGVAGSHTVKLDIVVENGDGKGTKRVHYEGNAEGLSDVVQVIHEASQL